jgi:hypothetical protein
MVEVTEDHSLLGPNLELIKPQEAVKGTRLFHLECTDESEVQFVKPGDLDYWDKKVWFESRENLDLFAPACKKTKCARMDLAQYAYMKIRRMGLDVTLIDRGDHLIEISWCEHAHSPRDEVKSVRHLPHAGPVTVYDLETEAGTFQAGVGRMIVKNTDSVMVEFDVQGRKGQEAIDYSWTLGERAAEECTKLFKAPNDLELEKIYCPYFLYSKKRYAAKMYEAKTSPDGTVNVVFKKIDVKGLQVVRRDSCPFVRETLKKLLGMILESNDPRPVIEAARKAAKELMNGDVPMEKLLMSKQLAGSYKTKVAHVEVRDKMRARAPGSEPQQGDRVSFVIVKGSGKMFEKAEDPSWVREKGIPLDYDYYFSNQFKKPVQDLLEPLVNADDIFDNKFMAKTKSTSEIEARKAFLSRFGLKVSSVLKVSTV